MSAKKNVVCIKWGTNYSGDDVNKLYNNVLNNTNYDIDFYCFTDDINGLNNKIIVKPIPELKNVYNIGCQIYIKEVGQASCYSWVVGTLGFIKDYFEINYKSIYKKFGSASQEYLSGKVIEKYGGLNFWPEDWCRSFKVHCIPNPFLPFSRKFTMAKIPSGAKIICFHGVPKAKDAKNGIWPEKNPIKKFFYKHLRPVEWIEE